MAPLVSAATVEGLLKPRAYGQLKCYESAMIWAQTEGTICAPETSHAIACVIDEAKKAKEEGKEKTILFNYSGHGLMDLVGYEKYLTGQLQDYALPDAEMKKFLAELEGLPKPSAKKTGKW
jgi:tryptophan synthase beta chain